MGAGPGMDPTVHCNPSNWPGSWRQQELAKYLLNECMNACSPSFQSCFPPMHTPCIVHNNMQRQIWSCPARPTLIPAPLTISSGLSQAIQGPTRSAPGYLFSLKPIQVSCAPCPARVHNFYFPPGLSLSDTSSFIKKALLSKPPLKGYILSGLLLGPLTQATS